MNSKLQMHFPIIYFLEHRSCDHHHMLCQMRIEAVPMLLALFQLQLLSVDVLMHLLENTLAEEMSIHLLIKSFLKIVPLSFDPICFFLFLSLLHIRCLLCHDLLITWSTSYIIKGVDNVQELYSCLIIERTILDQWRN